MAAKCCIDSSHGALRNTPDQRDIGTGEIAGTAVIGEGLGKHPVGMIGLGDNHDPTGVLVQAVNDAWPPHATDAGKAGAAMMNQGVDQRSGPVAGAGMDNQSGRFVDDD